MSNAEAAQTKALRALSKILDDEAGKIEVRVEAAKIILNRPRFFISPDVKEA